MSTDEKKPILKDNQKKIVFELISVIIGLIIAFSTPPAGLTVQAMWVFGILMWAICNWILQPIPDYVASMLMCVLWAGTKAVPFKTAFGSFGDTTWWMLIGAIGIGIGVTKSGLLKRVSLMAIKLFPPTYKGQVMALLGAGTLAAPIIPSTTAKCAITAPFAMGIGEQLGFEKRSQGMAGLFAAMYTGFSLNGVIFISASFLGYVILGLLPKETQAQFSWSYWFICMIPWAIVLLVGSYFAITRMYKPEDEKALSRDYIKKQIAELGPMNRNEKITCLVLVCALGFWITERIVGIPAVITALAGMWILMALNVFGKEEFHSKMIWSLMFFIGGVLNLVNVLPAVGIDKWIGTNLGPYLTQFVGNPYLLITATAITIYLMRAVIVSLTAGMTIFTVMLLPFASVAGINPWVIGMVSYVSVMVWYLPYQNANFLSAFAAAGGEDRVAYKHTVKASVAYMIISLIGLLISVPYWKFLGLIK